MGPASHGNGKVGCRGSRVLCPPSAASALHHVWNVNAFPPPHLATSNLIRQCHLITVPGIYILYIFIYQQMDYNPVHILNYQLFWNIIPYLISFPCWAGHKLMGSTCIELNKSTHACGILYYKLSANRFSLTLQATSRFRVDFSFFLFLIFFIFFNRLTFEMYWSSKFNHQDFYLSYSHFTFTLLFRSGNTLRMGMEYWKLVIEFAFVRPTVD